MGDVTVALIVLAVFFTAMAYVMWCGRLTGPDPDDIEMGAGFADLRDQEERPRRRWRRAQAAPARHARHRPPVSAVRAHH